MAKYVVATTEEIPPGTRKIVQVAGRSIGVFNVGGEYVALRNRCPHQGGPLCEGFLFGALASTRPGEYLRGKPDELIRCPWHGWEYDLRSGQSWYDPVHTRVRRYTVSVAPGSAIAETDSAPEEGRQGPYVAETYPVSVDQQYVVVDVST